MMCIASETGLTFKFCRLCFLGTGQSWSSTSQR